MGRAIKVLKKEQSKNDIKFKKTPGAEALKFLERNKELDKAIAAINSVKKLSEALGMANEYVKHCRDHIAQTPEGLEVMKGLVKYNEYLLKEVE